MVSLSTRLAFRFDARKKSKGYAGAESKSLPSDVNFSLVLDNQSLNDSLVVQKIRDSGPFRTVSTRDRSLCLMKTQATQLNFSAIREGEEMG